MAAPAARPQSRGPAPPKGGLLPPPPRGAIERKGPKLRPLFWTPVSQPAAETMWGDLVPPASFDAALLEQRFAMAAGGPCPSVSGARRLSSPDRCRRLRILDQRASQNLAIAFTKFPPPEQLAALIDSQEDFPDGLPAEAVTALAEGMSMQHEAVAQIRQLELTDSDLAQLDIPERYLWAVDRVPHWSAKLACGALIIGYASDLGDLRRAFERVGVCCQALRRSEVLLKCVSTALSVGNVVNRGTARAGATGLMLPESLLKLEELRCSDPCDGLSTLLDFVIRALVSESGKHPDVLRIQVEGLLEKTRAAETVCLDEAEDLCRRIIEQAEVALRAISEVPCGPQVLRLTTKVQELCEEGRFAAKMMDRAKDVLSETQQWSSARIGTKSEDWFKKWSQFLTQLLNALARAPTPSMPLGECNGIIAPTKPWRSERPSSRLSTTNKEN